MLCDSDDSGEEKALLLVQEDGIYSDGEIMASPWTENAVSCFF